MELFVLLIVISFIGFVFRLLAGVANHGIGGARDSLQRAKEGKDEIRSWHKKGIDTARCTTEQRFCTYCGAQRTTDVCGSCHRA